MYLICKDEDEAERARRLLFEKYLPISRFTVADLEVCITPYVNRYLRTLRIAGIRLRTRKHFCGQHPNACPINPYFTKKHQSNRFLEGADYVAFNDMLNDMCDEHEIEADIWSKSREFRGKLYLRRGRQRRVRYHSDAIPATHTTFYVWITQHDDNDFSDQFGHKTRLRADYPTGTPGIPEWLMSKEAKLLRRINHEHELEHV